MRAMILEIAGQNFEGEVLKSDLIVAKFSGYKERGDL